MVVICAETDQKSDECRKAASIAKIYSQFSGSCLKEYLQRNSMVCNEVCMQVSTTHCYQFQS